MTNFRWVAERRCWRPATSAVSMQLSIKYSGAVPWRHRYMSTASLNHTRSATSSQWSSSFSICDEPLSYFPVLVTTQAAEFITLCNLSVMTLGDSASTALQQSTRDVTNVCTRVLADPTSNNCRTRRIDLRWKKQAALMAETCFSKLKSDDRITPRTRTCPLGSILFEPSLMAGPLPSSFRKVYFKPDHRSSVFSVFCLKPCTDIQRLISVTLYEGGSKNFASRYVSLKNFSKSIHR